MRESNFVDSSLQSRKFKFLTWQNFQVISVGDKFWSECRLDQRQGLVPGASIAPVNLSPLRAGQRICVARSGYIAQQPGDLNIKKGIRVTPDKHFKQRNKLWHFLKFTEYSFLYFQLLFLAKLTLSLLFLTRDLHLIKFPTLQHYSSF